MRLGGTTLAILFGLVAVGLESACLYHPPTLSRPGDRDARGDAAGDDATGGDDGRGDGAVATFTVGGRVNGPDSTAKVFLRLNGGETWPASMNTNFTFSTHLAGGASYSVRVIGVDPDLACDVQNGSGTVANANVTDVVVACTAPTTGPLYDVAPDWLDFIANDGGDVYTALGNACDPALAIGSRGYGECLNGGQLRKVTLPGFSACAQLNASDSAGVFQWHCFVSGASIQFLSFTLNDGKGLADLIDPSGTSFKSMSVIVNGTSGPVAQTRSTIWWANPVVPVTSSTRQLADPGTIYVVASDTTLDTLVEIVTSRVALVTLPGKTLGSAASGSSDLVLADSDNAHTIPRDMLWVEGRFDLANAGRIYFHYPRFMTARNVTVLGDPTGPNSMNRGFDLCGAYSGSFENIRSSGSAEFGVTFNGGQRNHFKAIRADNTPSDTGLWVGNDCEAPYNNTFEDVLVANSFQGLVDIGSDNRFVGLTLLGAYYRSMVIGGHDVLIDATIINSPDAGIMAQAHGRLTLMNVLATNNGFSGSAAGFVAGTGVDDNTFINLASVHNRYGVTLSGSETNYFSGKLYLDGAGTPSCVVTGLYPGLDESTCNGLGSSNAVAEAGHDASTGLVGKATSDNKSPQGAGGTAGYAAIDDWMTFERPLRGWGKDGGAFPSPDDEGTCSGTGTCRIWDASLRASDSTVREVLPLPTGSDFVFHIWSPTTEDDCSLVPGARWSDTVCSHPGYFYQFECESAGGNSGNWSSFKCISVFLRNAVELSGDLIGNDNGLCESNETCLYTPNIGAYQGHGLLVSAGTFVPARLTGITLVRYEQNGY